MTNSPEPTIYARAEVLSGYSDLVLKLGANPQSILSKVKLTTETLADADNCVNFSSIRDLLQLTADNCKAPFFGLLLAQNQPIETIGVAGQLALLSPNLREALKSAFKYMQLQTEGGAWHIEENSSIAYIYRKERFPTQYAMDQLAIYNLAKLCINLRSLLGKNWAPKRALFDFAQPKEKSELKQFFRAPLHFDQEYPGLIIPAKVLDEPLESPDSDLYQEVEKDAQQLIENSPPQLDLINQVKELIWEDISSGRCDAATVAKKLSMHPKTLQRQLTAKGVSFRDLENTVKIDISKRYLQTTDNSISEISSLLGYGSLSAFTRAFKKIAGQPPISWRRNHR